MFPSKSNSMTSIGTFSSLCFLICLYTSLQIKANTARHVSEIIQENKIEGFFDLICGETYKHMRKHSEEKVPIDVILFDFEGKILARKSEQ